MVNSNTKFEKMEALRKFGSDCGNIEMIVHSGQNIPFSHKDNFLDLMKSRKLDARMAITSMSKNEEDILIFERYDPSLFTNIVINTCNLTFGKNANLHSHDYFELTFIIQGEVEVQVEKKIRTYKQGDVLLLNRNTRHSEEYLKKNSSVFYLGLSEEYLQSWPVDDEELNKSKTIFASFLKNNVNDMEKRNKDYVEFFYNQEKAHPSEANKILMEIILELKTRQPGYMIVIRGLIFRLLILLNNRNHYVSNYNDLGVDQKNSLASDVKSYLDKTKYRITREQLGQELHYNGDYLNRIFKKKYGYSIKEYNQTIYMNEATRLLAKSTFSIQKISKLLGFENKTHFYHLFDTHYDMTPLDYRQKFVESDQKEPERKLNF